MLDDTDAIDLDAPRAATDPYAHLIASDGPPDSELPFDLWQLRQTPACDLCGSPIYRGDADQTGSRHQWCGRFLTRLDTRWNEGRQPIAA